MRGNWPEFNFSPSQHQDASLKLYVAIINAWIRLSAVRFCSGVPDIWAIRSPREVLDSEISTTAPEIWDRNKYAWEIPLNQTIFYIFRKDRVNFQVLINTKGIEIHFRSKCKTPRTRLSWVNKQSFLPYVIAKQTPAYNHWKTKSVTRTRKVTEPSIHWIKPQYKYFI